MHGGGDHAEEELAIVGPVHRPPAGPVRAPRPAGHRHPHRRRAGRDGRRGAAGLGGGHERRNEHSPADGDERARVLHPARPQARALPGDGREAGLPEDGEERDHLAGQPGGAGRLHAQARVHRVGRRGHRGRAAARDRDVVAGSRDRPEEDRRAAAQRPGLQPARPALARRPGRHASPGLHRLQGGPQRQRQPRVHECLPARRGRQHVLLQQLPRRQRPGRAALRRGAAGVQDPDQRLRRGVRPLRRRGDQRHDPLRHQLLQGHGLRVPEE